MSEVIETTAAPTAPAAPSTTVETTPAVAPAPAATIVPAASETTTTEAAKPAEEVSPVPEKYELKIPDGSKLGSEHAQKVETLAREHGLSNKQAQAILDRDHATFEANQPGGSEWTTRVDAWEKSALADKEIGGTKEQLAVSAELGSRVLKKYFPESIHQFLQNTGYGSHPDIMKGFAKLGRAMGEDKIIQPGSQTTGTVSMEEKFYGGSKS